MFKLIFRQVLLEPYRVLLTGASIASALALILLLEGFQTGLYVQLKNVALQRGADLIVAQSGVSNFIATHSILPQLSRQRIEDIPDVATADPITMIPLIYAQAGYRKSPIFFMVYDSSGGPANISSGETSKEPRAIVIDEAIAKLYDLNVGDPFIVADFEFRITGITQQAAALFTAFAFINYDDMIDFFFESDLVDDISNLPLLSYLLVKVTPGADIKAIAATIETVEPDADVFLPEQLAMQDAQLGRTLFGPVMRLLIGAGYIIALLIIGMIMFATVHARLRNFGVMKALGFPNHFLIKGIILESMLMILLAFPIAILLATVGAWIIEATEPLYLIQVIDISALSRSFLSALALAMIGAYLPYRLIVNLDPATVFKN